MLQLETQRKADAAEAWNIFANNDVENAPVYIIPGLNSYYNR